MNIQTDNDQALIYRAVLNDEEQFAVFPQHMPLPAGWRDTGTVGTRDEILAHIKRVWSDMRPLSVRLQIETVARRHLRM